MRIIVLSDTHGNYQILETILLRHADADACIHLGDGEREVHLFLSNHPEWQQKFFAVKGNCDFNNEMPLSLTLHLIPNHRILLHTAIVMQSTIPLIFFCKRQRHKIVISSYTGTLMSAVTNIFRTALTC